MSITNSLFGNSKLKSGKHVKFYFVGDGIKGQIIPFDIGSNVVSYAKEFR